MKKMLMLATTAAMIEQFNKNNIEILLELGYEVHVAGNFLEGNPISEQRIEEFQQWLKEHRAKWFHIPATRKPYDLKNNGKAYHMVVSLIEKYQYEFIHCHTPIGSVIGRIAAHKTHTKIIYTAHGFHFFKGAPLKNWLIYYPVERFLSRWTDVLVTINNEDYARAKKHMHAKHVEYVPGVGIDLQKFAPDNLSQEEKEELRKSLGVGENDKLLLSVGELIKRKNHETVIRAIAKLGNPHIKYYICGSGELMGYLQKLIDDLQLSESVKLLGYRTDISELCECTDLFVFPSLQEGLPVALMEAVASKVPVIGSNIRGNTDLLGREALFDCRDVEGIAEKIKVYLTDDCSEEAERNYRNLQKYDIGTVISDMQELYSLGNKASS